MSFPFFTRSRRSSAALAVGACTTVILLTAVGCNGSSSVPIPKSTPAPLSNLPPNPGFEVPESGTSDNWPTYAHDMLRTGFEPNPTGITQSTVATLHLAWTYQSSTNAMFSASPILYDGMLYVADENGELTALNAKTGAIAWQDQMGLWTEMTPAIYDGILFVGQHDYPSQLTALDPSTGQTLWTQQVPGGLAGSPVAVNGVLYAGVALGDAGFCHAGGVYSFDEKTGSPQTIWLTAPSVPSGDGGAVWAPLGFNGTSLLYGTGNTCNTAPADANSIVAADESLVPQWYIPTASANHDDDVGGGILVLGSTGYVMAKSGYLYAVNVSSGQTLWKKDIGNGDELGGHMTPGYTDSTLIISGGFMNFPYNNAPPPGGTLYGLSLNGTIKWKRTMNWPIASYVATTTDLAFATIDNSIAALDPSTGTTLWSYQTAGDFHGGPVVTSDGVFAADMSGKVYAFTLGATTVAASRAPKKIASEDAVSGPAPLPPRYCKLR